MALVPRARRRRARRTSTPSPTPTTPRSRRTPTATSPRASGRACGRCTRSARRSSCRPRCPGSTRDRVRFVPHHVAHAASATFAVGLRPLRGARARRPRRARLAPRRPLRATAASRSLAAQGLPHSLGLLYEELTAHLGFRRSSDEYKVMAMASYGRPRSSTQLPRARARRRRRRLPRRAGRPRGLRAGARARRRVHRAPRRPRVRRVQARLEEVLLDLARWLHERTGDARLAMAGGVALNCVANSRIWPEGPVRRRLGAARRGRRGHRARRRAARRPRARRRRRPDADRRARARLGRRRARGAARDRAGVAFERPPTSPTRSPRCSPPTASSRGSRAAGSTARARSGTAACSPTRAAPSNLERLNDVKGREQFRPVAPMVLAERAAEVFDGPAPEPVHALHPPRAPGLGGAHPGRRARRRHRAHPDRRPPRASRSWRAMLEAFEARTGVPVVVNTSLNTAGRPMVDDPRDALECFGSAPVDALAIGPLPRAPPGAAPSRPALTPPVDASAT